MFLGIFITMGLSLRVVPHSHTMYTKYIVWLPMAVDLHWGWWSRDTVNSQQQQNKTTKALHTLNQSSLNTKYTSPSASLQTVVMMRPMNRRWFLSLLFSKNILELEAWFWALKALFQDMPATRSLVPRTGILFQRYVSAMTIDFTAYKTKPYHFTI